MGTSVGVCAKTQEGRVMEQDEVCLRICGSQLGRICEKGCMLHFKSSVARLGQGWRLFRNVISEGTLLDVAFINDGKSLTSYIYSKGESIKSFMDTLSVYRLSKSELQLLEKFLYGFSSSEITEQLFISKATLRTHLNNIYKKVPEDLKKEILAIHFGREA